MTQDSIISLITPHNQTFRIVTISRSFTRESLSRCNRCPSLKFSCPAFDALRLWCVCDLLPFLTAIEGDTSGRLALNPWKRLNALSPVSGMSYSNSSGKYVICRNEISLGDNVVRRSSEGDAADNIRFCREGRLTKWGARLSRGYRGLYRYYLLQISGPWNVNLLLRPRLFVFSALRGREKRLRKRVVVGLSLVERRMWVWHWMRRVLKELRGTYLCLDSWAVHRSTWCLWMFGLTACFHLTSRCFWRCWISQKPRGFDHQFSCWGADISQGRSQPTRTQKDLKNWTSQSANTVFTYYVVVIRGIPDITEPS